MSDVQGTSRQVPGMRARRTRAGRGMVRTSREQIRTHKELCRRQALLTLIIIRFYLKKISVPREKPNILPKSSLGIAKKSLFLGARNVNLMKPQDRNDSPMCVE